MRARRRAGALERGLQHEAFITVASMPMVSPIGRDTPRAGHLDAAEDVAAADHDAELDAELARAATRSAARRSIVGWSMPKPFGPQSASPDTLTITRR